jgi:hypothetical protein
MKLCAEVQSVWREHWGSPHSRRTTSGAMRRSSRLMHVLLVVLYVPGRSGSTPKHTEEPLQNVAASSVGGRAFAAHSQPTFDAALAIDGLEENGRGWAYHGQIEKAAIIFAFDHARCGITRAVCRERTVAAVRTAGLTARCPAQPRLSDSRGIGPGLQGPPHRDDAPLLLAGTPCR